MAAIRNFLAASPKIPQGDLHCRLALWPAANKTYKTLKSRAPRNRGSRHRLIAIGKRRSATMNGTLGKEPKS